MRNQPDAGWHQSRENEIIAHVTRLLGEPKFVIDTTLGQRPVAMLKKQTAESDKAVDLKRLMSQDRPDRSLEARMPIGRTLEATLSVDKWFIFQKVVGRLVAVVIAPSKALISNEPPQPLSSGETRRQLAALPPPLPGIPTTVIFCSTSGFSPEAREIAERTSERNVMLVEPNDAGGWSVHGSTEIAGVTELLDPEPAIEKEKRVHQTLELLRDELLTGSISAERVSVLAELPLMTVENAVKSFATQQGLVAKRLDGRLLLYRHGAAVPQGRAVGGEGMTMVDRIKLLFNRKGDHEKKVAFLSERRAALSHQRDTAGDELFKLEKRESQLRHDFKDNDSVSARRRVTSELVQLKKEIDRRQQLQQVVTQQINIVGTHLHNLELLKQGRSANLPSTDEIATDAAAAEEMLAQLQADSELVDAVGSSSIAGMSGEEQALYDQLIAEETSAVPEKTIVSQTPEAVKVEPAKSPASLGTPTREPG